MSAIKLFSIEIEGDEFNIPFPVHELIINISKERDVVALDFADWLMDNCELSEDNTIWSLKSEDYTNEALYEIFTIHQQTSKIGS